MVERRYGAGLSLKSSQALGIAGHVLRQDLEGHVAAELAVGGAIHLPHSACANRSVNAVVRECAADHIEPSGEPAVVSYSFVSEQRQWRFYTKEYRGIVSE